MKITVFFGKRIKEFRQKINISQEELAYRTELHRTYISSIESGRRNVSLINIEKLAKAFDCEISELFK